jgi:hypothetical protein
VAASSASAITSRQRSVPRTELRAQGVAVAVDDQARQAVGLAVHQAHAVAGDRQALRAGPRRRAMRRCSKKARVDALGLVEAPGAHADHRGGCTRPRPGSGRRRFDAHGLAGVGLALGDAALEHPGVAAQQRALLAFAQRDRIDFMLAIPMRLRVGGRPLDLSSPLAGQLPAAPSGRVLLLVHGLCMNDLQWSRRGHDHGQMLAAELGATALYLHYNTGRHVSQNGRELAALLETLLVAAWPVPVRSW